MKASRRCLLSCVAVFLAAILFTGCKAQPPQNFQLYIGAPYLVEKRIPQVADSIREAQPGLSAEGAMDCIYVKAGDLDNKQDARAGTYGMQDITKKLTAGQIDVLIATAEVGRVQALNNLLLPLSDIFTEEELSGLSNQVVRYDYVDIMLHMDLPTGQSTPDCGLDLSEHEFITPLVSSEDLGVYVAANAPHPEQAKMLIRYLAGLDS